MADDGVCPKCGLDTPEWCLEPPVFAAGLPDEGSLYVIPAPEGMSFIEGFHWRRDPAHPERKELRSGTGVEFFRRLDQAASFTPEQVKQMQDDGTVCTCPKEDS